MKYGNYDAWKLATPWDDEPEMPEVYETEKYGYFHTDENSSVTVIFVIVFIMLWRSERL